jgi:hypothetical protein
MSCITGLRCQFGITGGLRCQFTKYTKPPLSACHFPTRPRPVITPEASRSLRLFPAADPSASSAPPRAHLVIAAPALCTQKAHGHCEYRDRSPVRSGRTDVTGLSDLSGLPAHAVRCGRQFGHVREPPRYPASIEVGLHRSATAAKRMTPRSREAETWRTSASV